MSRPVVCVSVGAVSAVHIQGEADSISHAFIIGRDLPLEV